MKLVAATLLLAAGQACVIPPSLSVGAEDAAVNSPPNILAVRIDGQDTPAPGPLAFAVADSATMTVDLLDTDLGDTLYVGVFIDYLQATSSTTGNELPARNPSCQAPPSATNPTAHRTASCDLGSVCIAADAMSTPPGSPPGSLAGQHYMTVVVFDRPPDAAGEPVFQAMQPGGLSDTWFYLENCAP